MRLVVTAVTLLVVTTTTTGAWAANGCATGSYSVTPVAPTPTDKIFSVLFSAFESTVTNSVADNAVCNLSVPTGLPAGTISVYSADYRVFVNAGDETLLSVAHNGTNDSALVVGPENGVVLTHLIGSSSNGSINSTIALDFVTFGTPQSLADLDSIDYAELGRTTLTSVQSSINTLADEQTGTVTRLDATGDLVLGRNQPLEAPDNVSAFGAFGSHTLGATWHYNLGDGFSLEGGGAYTDQAVPGASFTGPLLGGAVRYLQPGRDAFRPFAEAGFNAAPGLGLTFSRHYDDGKPNGRTVSSGATGNLFGLYAEAGVLVAPSPNNEITFSGSLMRNWFGVSGYSETIGDTNLFPASLPASTGTFDTVKANLAWTIELSRELDLTLTAAVGKTFSHDGVAANVAFVGPVTGAAQDEAFAEYGARLGWKLSSATTADTFVFGSTGATSGSHLQIGEALHVAF